MMSVLPGNAPTSPLPLTDRIVIALDQLRIARDKGEIDREWTWQSMLDRLIERYGQGHR